MDRSEQYRHRPDFADALRSVLSLKQDGRVAVAPYNDSRLDVSRFSSGILELQRRTISKKALVSRAIAAKTPIVLLDGPDAWHRNTNTKQGFYRACSQLCCRRGCLFLCPPPEDTEDLLHSDRVSVFRERQERVRQPKQDSAHRRGDRGGVLLRQQDVWAPVPAGATGRITSLASGAGSPPRLSASCLFSPS